MAQHLKFYFSRNESLTVGLIFLLNSLMFGSWVTRIPSVKESLSLSEADLGLALLGAPLGALLIMPFSGWLIANLQLGRTVWISSLCHTLSVPLLVAAGSFWSLTIALAFFGFTNSIMDISMNAAAISTERKLNKNIVSTCHAMWSIGAMVGSGLGSIFVGIELNSMIHLSGLAAISLMVLFVLKKRILNYHEAPSYGDRVFAVPNKTLLLLALMGFCITVSEGGIADWSGVYMRETLHANEYLTGMAYAGFALLMAIGRLTGDVIIPKFGKKMVVSVGGFLATAGLGAGIIVSSPLAAIIGFSIAGLGYSCIVPILFISAANEPGYSSGSGIASVTTISYAGFLTGPPLIGFLAEAHGLNFGLGFIVLCSFLVGLFSLTVKFK